MRELYRRLGVFLLFFAALILLFTVRDGFVRVWPVDMGREYRAAYGPSTGAPGAMAAGARFIRSVTPFRTIADFIDFQTEGRLLTVEGDIWPEVFAGALSPSESGEAGRRESRGAFARGLYYHSGEGPFPAILDGLAEKGETFSYLRLRTPEGPRFLAMAAEGPGTALDNGVPGELARPFRVLAALPLLLGLALYIFLPGKKAPAGALVYPRWSAVILPDIISFVMSALFLGLPMVLCVHIFDRAGFLDFSSGSAWFTLVFWGMGLIFASILWWSAKYAAFALLILPDELYLRTLGRERHIPFADIESAGFADYRPPKWLRTVMFIAGLVNWRMMGQALLLSARADWGIEFRLRGGGAERFLCSGMPGAGKIVRALRLHKIPFAKEIETAVKNSGGEDNEDGRQ